MQYRSMVLASALLAVSGWLHAQSLYALQVRSMAAACAGCHGTHGLAEAGHFSLAGAAQEELLKTMLAFKAGTKPATLMHQIARGYSDEQLGALASYFSAQPNNRPHP